MIFAEGQAARTRSTSAMLVVSPVPAPETINASANPRSRVTRRVFDRPASQRHRMFDVDVGKDKGAGTNPLAITQGLISIAFDETLIGEHGTGVDIDANETALAGGAQSQGGRGIIAQNVETNWEFRLLAYGVASDGHGRNGFRADLSFRKRDITKVFNEKRVCAAALIGPRIDYC